MKNFSKNFFLPLKIRILIIIIFPVIFYPFIILYFNKYQEILINSEFVAMERQGITFAKAIGMAEDEYGLIEKNKISGVALQTLLASGDQSFQLKATLYNINGNLIADSDARFFSSRVEISKLPVFRENTDFNKILTNIVASLSKIISQPIDIKKYNKNYNNDLIKSISIKSALNGKTSRFVTIDNFKNLKLNVALPVKSLKVIRGVVVISSSGNKIENELLNLEIELFKTLGIILIVTILLAVYLIRSITNPIIKLANVADYISKNKIIRSKKLFEISSHNDEIGKLTKSFETMISEIEKRVNDIESFAADVAHELKNPLTSLRSASETLIQSKKKQDQEKMIEIMFKDIDRIDRLITDISFSSRLDADLIRTKFEDIEIFKLLENYISIRSAKLRYKINLQQNEKNLKIIGNSNNLVQVFDNIIDNSFSIIGKNCKIKIKVFSKDNKIFILFEDNGPGFPKNTINKIFDRFYTDRSNEKDFGKHSGLGLSISKQIISAHNGKIFAENILNKTKKIVGARVNIVIKNKF